MKTLRTLIPLLETSLLSHLGPELLAVLLFFLPLLFSLLITVIYCSGAGVCYEFCDLLTLEFRNLESFRESFLP